MKTYFCSGFNAKKDLFAMFSVIDSFVELNGLPSNIKPVFIEGETEGVTAFITPDFPYSFTLEEASTNKIKVFGVYIDLDPRLQEVYANNIAYGYPLIIQVDTDLDLNPRQYLLLEKASDPISI